MNISKKLIVLLLVVFLNVGGAFALEEIQVSKGALLTMEDCIGIALNNSPNVKRSKNYVKVAKSQVGQAKSDYFPKLGLGTGYYAQSDNPNGGRAPANNQYYNAEVSLNQMIYNFGKTNARIRMQKFNQIASDFDLSYTVIQTVYNVKTNYYGVLAAKANVDVSAAYVQINERQYQRTKAFFDEGLKSKIDLVNAEVLLSQSKIDLVNAEKSYQNAMIKLNNSMFVAYAPEYSVQNTETFNFKSNFTNVGLINIANAKSTADLPEDVKSAVFTSQVEKTDILKDYEFKKYPHTFEQCVELANTNRPDLKSFESTLSAMKEALLYVKREYYPELNGKVGYGYRNTNYYMNNGLNLSASLDFPLINGMNTKYKIDEAKAQLDLALNEIDLSKQNIYFEVQDAYVNMTQLEKQIPLMEVKVRQTLENLELADGRYEVGLGNFIELQDAKVNYNNAQQSYVQLIYDYNVARAQLEKAIALPQENNS